MKKAAEPVRMHALSLIKSVIGVAFKHRAHVQQGEAADATRRHIM